MFDNTDQIVIHETLFGTYFNSWRYLPRVTIITRVHSVHSRINSLRNVLRYACPLCMNASNLLRCIINFFLSISVCTCRVFLFVLTCTCMLGFFQLITVLCICMYGLCPCACVAYILITVTLLLLLLLLLLMMMLLLN